MDIGAFSPSAEVLHIGKNQHTVRILLLNKEMALINCGRNARTIVSNDRKEGSKAPKSNAGKSLKTKYCRSLKTKKNVQDHGEVCGECGS